jgi:hypothetical protein
LKSFSRSSPDSSSLSFSRIESIASTPCSQKWHGTCISRAQSRAFFTSNMSCQTHICKISQCAKLWLPLLLPRGKTSLWEKTVNPLQANTTSTLNSLNPKPTSVKSHSAKLWIRLSSTWGNKHLEKQ